MFTIFSSVKNLLKINPVSIDNNLFRLHYKATVIILITFSLLVTARQYIGDPIKCIVDEIPHEVMNAYCWITSTFTLPNRMGTVGRDLLYQGVAAQIHESDQVQYHKYYQWVCFVLFFQAMLFYFPRYLWKSWEGGRIKSLVADLSFQTESTKLKEKRKLLVGYLKNNRTHFDFYAYKFFFCEFLNFVNVVSQIFFMDYFLDGQFSTYGLKVIQFSELEPEQRNDPMSRVFPKLTKCTFHKYGSSGSVQKFDGLCVLPLNIINEKIYVFLWFWFIFLSALSSLSLIYRAAIICSPKMRLFLLRAKSRISRRDMVNIVANSCNIGDWFLIYQLGKNLDLVVYSQVIDELALEHLGGTEKNT